ncbi:MAG: cytochrome c oxidase subunit 4, partial [Flavobacteriales bacterium]
MGHHEHSLAIFRGRLKFKTIEQKIWGVFIFLSIITIIEVALGIIKPISLMS